MTPMRVTLGLGLSLGLALGCGERPSDDAPALEPAAPEASEERARTALPAAFRAVVVLEPPRIEIGDPFTVEIAVVTPPGHRVAPAPVPKAVEGLWILDAERPSVDREPGRWVHHQRFRARARSTGPFAWPALELGVEGPDGTRRIVTAPERPFEVSSLLEEHPEQRSFFSYRPPRLVDAEGSGPWLPALLGALFALAGVALFSLVRRVRSASDAATLALAEGPGSSAAEDEALAALAGAEAALDDPRHALDLASGALRGWAATRARAPGLRAASSEELAEAKAPFLLSTRYAPFVALVRELDALRFPPLETDAPARARDAIARTAAFVARSRARS